ncbi:MAG: succinyldiaminopimelate transaminase [Helicobacteraceae bacterium]|jgi:aspartate/methionine/tyrosine aminotransferase|nr:succinyldiaminopimelate transaminase [Helicobacteraceae bacterium]
MSYDFEPYPFEKLRSLLEDVQPNADKTPINLHIGEPQFQTPKAILEVLSAHNALFNKYPLSGGIPKLKEAQISFVDRRFGVKLTSDQIAPTLGTREALFNLPQCLLFGKDKSTIAYPNPFYQIYEGAAKASRAQSVLLNLEAANSFKPDITDPRLKNCDLVILNSPNNPTGSVLTLEEMIEWAKLSEKYGFVLLNDECYSEIYFTAPPPSLLEAAKAIGNDNFSNILVVNSLSKRSSAAGIRSGFIAGDKVILSKYATYRSYAGITAGIPLQIAAAYAWLEDKHSEEIRLKYAVNMRFAQDTLNIKTPESTFYLWLEAKDDLKAAHELYERYALKTLPGTFLSRGKSPLGFIRIALVYEENETIEALNRLKEFFAP